MKWKKYTIETTTAAEDFMSSMLMDLGIEGIEIEDNIPLTKEDQADMFIDFLPELPPDEGISHVSFYVEEDGSDQTEILKQVNTNLFSSNCGFSRLFSDIYSPSLPTKLIL